MKHSLPLFAALTALGACQSTTDAVTPMRDAVQAVQASATKPNLDLGAFSVSLAVKDIATSAAFYKKLGFERTMGDPAQNWLILRNGEHVIGLFQGLFPKNVMTFNPGWTQQATPSGSFVDVRELQRRLEAEGLELTTRADENGTGPASFTLNDPDGNPIFIDQHVAAPK